MNHARIVLTCSNGAGQEWLTDSHAIDPDGRIEARLTMNLGRNGKYVGNAAPAPRPSPNLITRLKR